MTYDLKNRICVSYTYDSFYSQRYYLLTCAYGGHENEAYLC